MKKPVYRLTLITLLLFTAPSFGAIINQIGSNFNWNVNWTAINSANDPNDGLAKTQIDFVGDAANPGAYWADQNGYVFFRFQVNVATVTSTTFRDSHFLLIDVNNYLYGTGFGTDVTGRPDFGFSWDSKSNDPEKHGLEMLVYNSGANIWNGINMTDLDGDSGQKGTSDINGDSRTTDGYVRTEDSLITANLGTTTFIEYAISWSYLETYTDLERGQTWSVALASLANATDHNNLTGDIGGGANPSSLITDGWSSLGVVPEPATIGLISVTGLFALLWRRRTTAN
jgi:hypothetical protein